MLIPISSLKKTLKNGATMTGAPNANPHKLVEKNIEKRNHQTWTNSGLKTWG